MSLPHPTTLTSIHASLPHFLPSPALASPVGSPSSQPNIAVSNAQCSTLFVANLGQLVSEHELKDIFSRSDILKLHSPSLAPRTNRMRGRVFIYRFRCYLYIHTWPTCAWLPITFREPDRELPKNRLRTTQRRSSELPRPSRDSYREHAT